MSATGTTARAPFASAVNGTGAFVAARGAAEVLAGCLLNVGRVADHLRGLLATQDRDIAIVCAGQDGRVALEDVLCAGLLLDRLWGDSIPERLRDGAHIALTQYRHDSRRLAWALFGSAHTQRLIALGYSDDVAFCARLDAFPLLPRYHDSRLILDADDRAWAASRADRPPAVEPAAVATDP